MTVDGVILERLIRKLILQEFGQLTALQSNQTEELKKLRTSLQIESSKILDNSMRLKRLSDEFMRKSQYDNQHLVRMDAID